MQTDKHSLIRQLEEGKRDTLPLTGEEMAELYLSLKAELEAERAKKSNLTLHVVQENWRKEKERAAELQQERDALAEHVERLRNACQMAFQTPLDEHYSKGVNVALHHAIESTGENNLTRRDLIKQSEGLRLAADFIEQKATDYDAEHGSTDPSTGHREYPGDGADYYNEMIELADDLRQRAQELTQCH